MISKSILFACYLKTHFEDVEQKTHSHGLGVTYKLFKRVPRRLEDSPPPRTK